MLGVRWDLTILEEVAGEAREDDALLSIVEVALHANLLVDGPGTPTELQFVHPLVQETLYSSLSAARRAVLHRRCGDVMARRGYPSAIVAHHYAAGATADSAEKTVEWLTRAAGELVESVAIDEALALLDRALVVSDLTVRPHHEAKARLRLAMSLVFGLAGYTVAVEAPGRAGCRRGPVRRRPGPPRGRRHPTGEVAGVGLGEPRPAGARRRSPRAHRCHGPGSPSDAARRAGVVPGHLRRLERRRRRHPRRRSTGPRRLRR